VLQQRQQPQRPFYGPLTENNPGEPEPVSGHINPCYHYPSVPGHINPCYHYPSVPPMRQQFWVLHQDWYWTNKTCYGVTHYNPTFPVIPYKLTGFVRGWNKVCRQGLCSTTAGRFSVNSRQRSRHELDSKTHHHSLTSRLQLPRINLSQCDHLSNDNSARPSLTAKA